MWKKTNMRKTGFGLLMVGMLWQLQANSQTIVPLESSATMREQTSISTNTAIHDSNYLPAGFEKETAEALSHFPELENVRVKFRVKKSFATLKTRPTLLSMVLPKGHRTYIITISNKTIDTLMPITLANLPERARVGVIGHELSHVADFSQKTTWNCIKVAVGHLSKKYLDSLEFHTDEICIEHGLGEDLEAWSAFIRNKMHTEYWRGADNVNKTDTHFERYMNPSTIERYIANDSVTRPAH